MLSHFSYIWLFATLCMVARHAPLSMRFSRQEYWSGLPSPPPGDLPDPGIKPTSLTSPALAGGSFTTSTTWEAHIYLYLSVLWPPHAKSCLIGKDSDAGRDWGQEEKGTTEDEMAGWHHRLDGHGFGWTPGVGDGQGGLACCSSWGRKESDTTERLNWIYIYTYINHLYIYIYRIILLYTWN